MLVPYTVTLNECKHQTKERTRTTMTKLTQTEMLELAVTLALSAKPHKQTLHESTDAIRTAVTDARALVKHANVIRRWAELQCNGIERYDAKARQFVASWTEADQTRADKMIEKARKAIREIVNDYQTERVFETLDGKTVDALFQGDPRGAVVRIAFKARYFTF